MDPHRHNGVGRAACARSVEQTANVSDHGETMQTVCGLIHRRSVSPRSETGGIQVLSNGGPV